MGRGANGCQSAHCCNEGVTRTAFVSRLPDLRNGGRPVIMAGHDANDLDTNKLPSCPAHFATERHHRFAQTTEFRRQLFTRLGFNMSHDHPKVNRSGHRTWPRGRRRRRIRCGSTRTDRVIRHRHFLRHRGQEKRSRLRSLQGLQRGECAMCCFRDDYRPQL